MPKTKVTARGGGAPLEFYYREFLAAEGLSGSDPNQANNTVYYSPVQIPHACTAEGIVIIAGANARQGHCYVALYDCDPLTWAPLNRVAVSADTVFAGTFRRQYIPFAAATPITSGLYFCAIIKSVAGDDLWRAVTGVWFLAPAGHLGPSFWTEAMGAYVIPPNPTVAPAQQLAIDNTVWMWLRVSV